MSLKYNWIDRQNGVDDVDAEDINKVAHAVIEVEERLDEGGIGGSGTTFFPSVSESGIISWTNDGGLPNPTPINIKGDRGENGPQGPAGKTAYQYAKEGGYQGTETDFKQNLAKDIPTITQEAGNSESLVMSQKAVTDLVADALGNQSTEYETVNSIEEMTDTSKQYVLSTTGTVWVYGEAGEPNPAFTNLATTFEVGRYKSDGTITTDNAQGAYVCTDWIPFYSGTVVRVKGFGDLLLHGTPVYTSIGAAPYSVSKLNNSSTYLSYSYDSASDTVTCVSSLQYSGGQIRFVGLPTQTTDDIIITVNEEIEYTTGQQWYDTGMAPSNSGGNYVDLLVKVNENTSEIREIDSRVTALETGSQTFTIPSFWQDAVEACIAKIKALQVGRNCVTFPFFSDNHTRDGKTQYAGVMIAHIMKECGIPYCFFGGDAITSAMASTADSDAEFRAQARAFDSAMSYIPEGRFCMSLGNHETWLVANPSIEGSTRVDYDRDQTYEIFLREEGTYQNKHFGGDGTYYYVDDIASKVRWIVLNTNGIGNSDIDSEQLSWFEHTALRFNDSGWGVVIVSHFPVTRHHNASGGFTNNATVIEMLQNYMSGSDANKADIIGWYSGHIHRDRIYTGVSVNDTDDSVGADMGFVQVTITSDHTGIAYPIGNSPTYHPVANDDKSHAIDFVTVNRSTRTVSITRLGVGQDRSYTY